VRFWEDEKTPEDLISQTASNLSKAVLIELMSCFSDENLKHASVETSASEMLRKALPEIGSLCVRVTIATYDLDEDDEDVGVCDTCEEWE